MLMDQKQQWEWCVYVFNIKANGLAVELFQIGTHARAIMVNKYIPLGLVFISSNTVTKRMKLTVGS
jgi:hypothetical protein